MNLTAILYAMILATTGADPSGPEGARLLTVAQAIEIAALEAPALYGVEPEQAAGVLLSIGQRESGWHRRIHVGECRAHECDHGRARGLWQCHRGDLTPGEWASLTREDLGSTITAAKVALRLWARGRSACRSEVGAFAMYARGRSCEWRKARWRWRHAVRMERLLALAGGEAVR